MADWLRQRVIQRLNALDLGPVEAAVAAKIERTFIRDIVDGRKQSVRADGAAKLEIALGIPKEAFLFEDFADFESHAAATAKGDLENDKVLVSQLDVRFGMGGGAIYDAPIEATPMTFSKAWIGQFTAAPVDQVFWASGFGDSMYPTISDGDVVLVDCSQKNPHIRDQIWALNQYGQGMIKRLRSTESGYAILSDNPQVPADSASDGSMEIVGRVVAVVRRL